MRNKTDFIDVEYPTKDDLFCAVRSRALTCGNGVHINSCYRSLLKTIKKEIPDNAVNCYFSIDEEWSEDNDCFFYELGYEIPKEQAYWLAYQGKISHCYENYNRWLWYDLESISL